MKITVEFEKGDLASLHDIMYDLTGHEYSDGELEKLFHVLPDHIKGEAYTWGPSDSVFRDNAYEYLKKEMEKKRLTSWEEEQR